MTAPPALQMAMTADAEGNPVELYWIGEEPVTKAAFELAQRDADEAVRAAQDAMNATLAESSVDRQAEITAADQRRTAAIEALVGLGLTQEVADTIVGSI